LIVSSSLNMFALNLKHVAHLQKTMFVDQRLSLNYRYSE